MRIPMRGQYDDYSCGPVAVEALLRFFKRPVPKDLTKRVVAFLNGPSWLRGARPWKIFKELKRAGLQVTPTKVHTIKGTKVPVLLLLRVPLHWTVSGGMRNDKLIATDDGDTDIKSVLACWAISAG